MPDLDVLQNGLRVESGPVWQRTVWPRSDVDTVKEDPFQTGCLPLSYSGNLGVKWRILQGWKREGGGPLHHSHLEQFQVHWCVCPPPPGPSV